MEWIVIAIAGLCVLILCAIYGAYRYVFYSPKGDQNNDYQIIGPLTEAQRNTTVALIDAINRRPYEHVSIRSRDGLKLMGRYCHTQDGAPLVILCHGYRGTPSRDFCGGADICFDAGYNVLLIEERAHCSSEGHTISFGVNERFDVCDWVSYAVGRFGSDIQILLVGISMGAATVLLASELDLPENVRGILADCPFTTAKAIIAETGKKIRIPAAVSVPLAKAAALVFGGFRLDAADTTAAVRNAKVPVLLIHGEADDLVPCDMGRAIAAVDPDRIELHTFPGAGHGLSYLVDPDRYTKLVRDFCARIFQPTK